MHVSVIGTGYLGSAHAACLAALGHQVVGIDTDHDRVVMLRSGRSPFCEPGLGELVAEGRQSGRLDFSTDLAAVRCADVHFVCVGTPQRDDGQAADLRAVEQVVDRLADLLDGRHLVVGKSTVPVGTAEMLQQRLDDAGAAEVEVAWNPEFLREAHAIEDSLRPDRVVLGVQSPHGEQRLRELYAPLIDAGVPVVTTDLATAELAKVSANTMLAARISIVNVLAEVCEAAGADIGDLITILGHDDRIGPSFLSPGVGYGGGCLPKDTRAFVARARELGVDAPLALIEAVDAVNAHQRERTVRLVTTAVGGSVRGRRVAVWGAAFKAGSDDVRDSPALDVAGRLHTAGAEVRVYDPAAVPNARRVCPELCYVDSAEDAARDADVVVVLTDWPQFATADPTLLHDVVRHPGVVDARLVLDAQKWRAAGWDVHALGRGA